MSTTRTSGISPYLYWITAVALVLPIWAGRHFPTEDGPAHVYYTEVYRNLGKPNSIFEPFYERNVRWDTPNLTYFGAQYVLAGIVEPHLAQKVAASLIVLSTIGAIWVLARNVAGGVGLGALTALLLVHNYFLYAGYFSFLAGVPFLLLTLALLVGPLDDFHLPHSALTWSLLAVFLLGLASFYSHLVVGGVFLILVGLRVIFWPGASPRRRSLLILAALPIGVLILSYMLGPSTGSGGLRWLSPRDAVRSLVGLWFWRGFSVPGLGWEVRRTGLTVVIGVLLTWTVRALFVGELSRSRRFVLLVGGCLLLLRFATPDIIGQGSGLVERIDLIACLLVVPALSASTGRRWHAILVGTVLLTLAWQLTDDTLRIRRFNREYQAVEAQVARIPVGSIIHLGPDYQEIENRFEGSYTRVFAEIAQEVGYQCRCIVVGEHHPSTPYFWVAERPGARARARLLVRVDATHGHSGASEPDGLSLRVTEVQQLTQQN